MEWMDAGPVTTTTPSSSWGQGIQRRVALNMLVSYLLVCCYPEMLGNSHSDLDLANDTARAPHPLETHTLFFPHFHSREWGRRRADGDPTLSLFGDFTAATLSPFPTHSGCLKSRGLSLFLGVDSLAFICHFTARGMENIWTAVNAAADRSRDEGRA